jgi:alkylation response protein AidB-like acyl-CoA dehydrogenase
MRRASEPRRPRLAALETALGMMSAGGVGKARSLEQMSTSVARVAVNTSNETASVAAPRIVRLNSPELRALLAEIAEGASEREAKLIAPHAQIRQIAQAGLGRLRIPIEEGGAGATLRELFEFLIQLAAADSNVAHILRVHYWFVEAQLQRPASDPLRARYLGLVNEGHILGNGFSEQSERAVGLYFDTTLTRDPSGEGHRLNGKKFYSTGSLYASYTQIFASTPQGTIAAATIPVDRKGLTIADDWDGFGQRLTGTGTTLLNDVFVADDEVEIFGAPDGPQAPSYQYSFLQLFLQAVAAGILRAVLNDAVALVRRRKRNFSHAQAALPAADPQVLQVVGEIAADSFAADAIVLAAADVIAQAAASVNEGLPDKALAEQAQIAAAKAKVAIDRFAYATTSRLFDAGGASATQAVYNLDRHWRNARTASTHNPTFSKATAVGDFHVNGKQPPLNAYF